MLRLSRGVAGALDMSTPAWGSSANNPFVTGLIRAGQQTVHEIDEHTAAGGTSRTWLEMRWADLAAERPLVILPEHVVYAHEGAETLTAQQPRILQPVRASSIVEIDQERQWGHLNNRMHVFTEMLDNLLVADRTGGWTAWAKRWSNPVTVIALQARGREIYSIESDGRHRAMMAAALRFPEVLANVVRSDPITPGRRIGIPLSPRLDFDHQDALQQMGEVRGAGFHEESAHWASTVLADRRIDWWFQNPDDVVTASRAFQLAHPTVGLPAEMLDENAWRARFDPFVAWQLERKARKRWWRR